MLTFSDTIKSFLLNASAKALATYGPKGLNVVPVSVIQVHGYQIWLFDFFMHKTVANIQANSQVSLAFWSGLQGYQIKGRANYQTAGADFEQAKQYVAKHYPERILKGLLVLSVDEVWDVSVGGVS